MKILGKCQGSPQNHKGKKQFFIRKRRFTIPTGVEVTSQSLLCGKCYQGIKKSTNL